MRIRKIAKGGGRFRTIYCPNAKEKRRLRDLLPLLNEIHANAVDAAGTRGVAHAFVANRNPVTCAMPHRGFAVTISCDLENWFDTVREDQLVAAGVPPEVAKQITIDGVCRQGLPTSPVAANIAAVAMDKLILEDMSELADQWRIAFSYTRYADDITISARKEGGDWEPDNPFRPYFTDIIVARIENAATARGWKIAKHKTHIQHAKAGRRIVVGIAVDDRVQATRQTRRKLRAARHHARFAELPFSPVASPKKLNTKAKQSAAGLAEWAACKLPRRIRSTRQMMGVLAGACSVAATASGSQSPGVITGSGRRVLVPVREKIAEASANQ